MKQTRAEAQRMEDQDAGDEPVAPFGVLGPLPSGQPLQTARQELDPHLTHSIYRQAELNASDPSVLFYAALSLAIVHTADRSTAIFGCLRSSQNTDYEPIPPEAEPDVAVLRLDVQGMTAVGLVEAARSQAEKLLGPEIPPAALARRYRDGVGTTPLFSTLLRYRASTTLHSERQSPPGFEAASRQDLSRGYPIAVLVDETREGFVVSAQTDHRIDPQRWIQYVCAAIQSLVEALARDPHTAAGSLSILPQSEYRLVTEGFNVTTVQFPQGKLIHELFEEQAQSTPSALAVFDGRQSLTYGELNEKANQLAWYLIERGVGPDHIVGICVERGHEMVVGLLGILKAGGAYVSLDPTYPSDRLQFMMEDVSPRVVLTQKHLLSRVPSTTLEFVCLDADWSQIELEPARNPDPAALGLRSDHLAYLIYTSGSTGRPKGVAIEHRNTVNLIYWARTSLPGEFFGTTLHSTSLNFDLSVYECFVPLSLGASIYVVENAVAVAKWGAGTTLINTVPSAIRAVLDAGAIPETTRCVNLAGEALKKDLVDQIFQRSGVDYVCNLYGPSETTTYSSWVCMTREEGFAPTIGRPIANTQFYLLDARSQPVPIGVAGEIYIGGAGVARGYLNRPELTCERFIKKPFSADREARLYRTGDLGRWHADGSIEYLGRNDHQVKIRGFRIELGEIETQLLRHPQIKEAVVLAREDEPGDKRLVAYVVSRESFVPGNELSSERLRAHLKPVLPDYMVPGAFVLLESLPLTPNGKLDRGSLPPPQGRPQSTVEFIAPRNELERVIGEIWTQVLRVDGIGVQDSFLDLGGHSLHAMKLIAKIAEELKIDISVVDVLQSPTIEGMAQLLAAKESADVESRLPDELEYEDGVI